MRIPKPAEFNLTPEEIANGLVASAVAAVEKMTNVTVPLTAALVQPSGARFIIPLLVPEEIPTGDSRMFNAGSVDTREFPLPLLWQWKTSDGHDQSVVVGRIDSVDRTPLGLSNARGVFDTNPYAREAERMIRAGFLRGVSADLDKFEGYAVDQVEDADTLATNAEEGRKEIKNKKITVSKARLMGATIVPMPAFQEVIITLDEPELTDYTEGDIMPDGEYLEGSQDPYAVDALMASAAPIVPPREWFQRYNAKSPVPLTVEDTGRVYGYLALWESSHIGMGGKVRPPRSASNYQFFRTGVVRTDDGTDVTVGSLTLTGGHAPIQASAEQAIKHYDDTNSAVIDVVAGEDQFGIWLAGVLRPTVTPEQVRALRASGLSGDWRPINGRLELVRACFVNTPGFMTTRAMVAGGQLTALVAAGTATLEHMRDERLSKIDDLNSRLSQIETLEINRKREAALSRMSSHITEFRSKESEELASAVANLRSRMNLS